MPAPRTQDDTQAVEAVLSGDAEAFAGLVRTYEARVRRYCLLLMRNPVDADEAAQDVFVKAFRSLRGFRGHSSFLTWIGRIAHNHCMDVLRQRSRHRAESLDAIIGDGDTPALDRFAEKTPVADDDRDEMKDAVPRLLASMKPEYREILMLREVSEMSYDDIAAQLRCTLDTVKSRLRRARADLHERAMKMKRRVGGRT